MVHVDNLPRTIPMPRSGLLQFPVERLLLCCCTWSLTFQRLFLLGAIFDASTKCSVAWCGNMALLCLLFKQRVDGSHRWLFHRFVMLGNVLLKQGILLTVESRQVI